MRVGLLQLANKNQKGVLLDTFLFVSWKSNTRCISKRRMSMETFKIPVFGVDSKRNTDDITGPRRRLRFRRPEKVPGAGSIPLKRDNLSYYNDQFEPQVEKGHRLCGRQLEGPAGRVTAFELQLLNQALRLQSGDRRGRTPHLGELRMAGFPPGGLLIPRPIPY